MLFLLSLAFVPVLVKAQINVPDCLPAAFAVWNWVRVPFAFLPECSTNWRNLNRRITALIRALVQQPDILPQNATTAVSSPFP